MRDLTTPMIDLNGVSKRFELQGQRIEALRDANLHVHRGEFVCLIGASASPRFCASSPASRSRRMDRR